MFTSRLLQEVSDIRPIKLMLHPSGTYNDMFARPYETDIQAETLNHLVQKIERVNSTTITPGLVSDIAGGIIKPSAKPTGLVQIANGWATKRLKFVLVVSISYTSSPNTSEVHYIQGYTDYVGVSKQTMSLDPNMVFTINSVNKISVTNYSTNGYTNSNKRVIASDQILVNREVNTQLDNYYMRPVDVASNLEMLTLNNSAPIPEGQKIIDTRSGGGGLHDANLSKRTNNSPSAYLSDFMNSYFSANTRADDLDDKTDIMRYMVQDSHEGIMSTNPVIKHIARMTGVNIVNWFRYSDLLLAFPGIDAITTFIEEDVNASSPIHASGMTERHDYVTREVVAATMLSQCVPAIMTQCMLNGIHFRCTNSDLGGNFNMVIINYKSLNDNGPVIKAILDSFTSRFKTEIFRIISCDNADVVSLEMNCDLYSDTWINISIAGGPLVPFVFPTFCDSLSTPVVTTNHARLDSLSQEMDSLMAYCGDFVSRKRTNASQIDALFNYMPGANSTNNQAGNRIDALFDNIPNVNPINNQSSIYGVI